jgi:hypothetical protein
LFRPWQSRRTEPEQPSAAFTPCVAAKRDSACPLCVETAPLVRVNAVAPATVVRGSTMFPHDRVITSLANYGIPFAESETTEALRDKLAAFYAQRSLTRAPIKPPDQAEAILLLVSPRTAISRAPSRSPSRATSCAAMLRRGGGCPAI